MDEKNYKVIAEIIKKWAVNKDMMAIKLADYFEKDNEWGMELTNYSFNRKQFLKDCGVKHRKCPKCGEELIKISDDKKCVDEHLICSNCDGEYEG